MRSVATDLSATCATAKPEAVAIDPVRNIGVVTLNGCTTGMIAIVNLDYTNIHNYGKPYGQILAAANVGNLPWESMSSRGWDMPWLPTMPDGTASIIDISTPTSPTVFPSPVEPRPAAV